MKRPAFNAATLRHVRSDAQTGRVEIEAADERGNVQPIGLGPVAQDQILRLLLAGPPLDAPAEPGGSFRNVVVANGIRPYRTTNGNVQLEIAIGPAMALQVHLPGTLAADLERQLRELQAAPPA